VLARYFDNLLLRQLQLLLNLLPGDRCSEVDMVIGMVRKLMSFMNDASGDLGISGDPFANRKKSAQ
jgi:hypothetical protein